MLRADAKKLEGTLVEAWTPAWGEYVGTLIEVTDDRPWRGKVAIQYIKKYPISGLSSPAGNWVNRHPFYEGRIVEVGGVNIKPYTGELPSDYDTSLVQALETEISKYENYIADPLCRDRGLLRKALNGLYEHRKELEESDQRKALVRGFMQEFSAYCTDIEDPEVQTRLLAVGERLNQEDNEALEFYRINAEAQ